MKPTAEQQAALDVFNKGEDLVIEAGAGTGKTSTLVLLGEETRDRGVYIAYNKAIAAEAAGRFPANVTCRTAHSFAFRAVGKDYKDRLNGGLQPLWRVAKYLGIFDPFQAGERRLSVNTLARLAQEMVDNYCNSADDEITLYHGPWVDGVSDDRELEVDGEPAHVALARVLLPYARKAWDNLQNAADVDSPVRFKHDHYLKLWQLSHPVLKVDYVLFDEAQDANPVIAAIVGEQECQRVMVGDRAQAIYGWRGAVDAMEHFEGERVFLSQSFRFGQAVADVANGWLERLDTPLRLTGTDRIDSRIERLAQPRALLCWSNAGALDRLLDFQERGVKAHLVGGASDIGRFCSAVVDLQTKGNTQHRDLIAFESWEEVVQYVKDDRRSAGDLGTWVNIIERYGVERVRDAINGQHKDEETAEVTISTAHKAKGREWDSVQIGQDFEPKVDQETGEVKPPSPGEIMLNYVAVTRAKLVLDPGPLATSGVWSDMPGDNIDPSADAIPADADGTWSLNVEHEDTCPVLAGAAVAVHGRTSRGCDTGLGHAKPIDVVNE